MGSRDRGSKSREVELTHRALIRLRVDEETIVFLVVQREVLHVREHVAALDAFDVRDGDFRGEQGVFSISLEGAAAGGDATDVHGRCFEHGAADGGHLLRDGRAILPGVVNVPAGGYGKRRRERGCMRLYEVCGPNARGAIGHR